MAASLRGRKPGSRGTSSQKRIAVVKSLQLAAEAGKSSGAERKGNVRRWKPLPSNGY
jgi:hypothetical protein